MLFRETIPSYSENNTKSIYTQHTYLFFILRLKHMAGELGEHSQYND